jgi:hypothetical protein
MACRPCLSSFLICLLALAPLHASAPRAWLQTSWRMRACTTAYPSKRCPHRLQQPGGRWVVLLFMASGVLLAPTTGLPY